MVRFIICLCLKIYSKRKLLSTTSEAKDIEEEVDEIQIEGQGGDDGEPCVIDSHVVDLLDLLRVVCREADENEHAEDAED